MSLILCRQEPVTVPLYIEDLGIHLYSSQELCYVIYNNPLLVLEGFIDKRLTEFLRSELRMPFLAERVEKWLDSHGATEEILYLILKECNYYTPKEQAAYRQTVNGLKKLSEEEYEKRRADYFYGLDLFGKAVTIYEQILDGAGRHLSGDFRGKVWNNIAACYAKLFCYQKAMHAYENAWNAKPEAEYVKRMYFLTILNPELSLKDKFREMIGEDDKEVWNKEVENKEETLRKIDEVVNRVKGQLASNQEVLPEQMNYLKQATVNKPLLVKQIRELREEREKLLVRIEKNKHSCIRVEGAVYSGIDITVKDVSKIQHEQVSHCRFVRDGADVRIVGL